MRLKPSHPRLNRDHPLAGSCAAAWALAGDGRDAGPAGNALAPAGAGWAAGPYGAALSFAGTTSSYALASRPASFGGRLSVLWVGAVTGDLGVGVQALAGAAAAATSGILGLYAHTASSGAHAAGSLGVQVRDDDGGASLFAASLPALHDGGTHSLLITRSGTAFAWYLDGQPANSYVNSAASGPLTLDVPLALGCLNSRGAIASPSLSRCSGLFLFGDALGADAAARLAADPFALVRPAAPRPYLFLPASPPPPGDIAPVGSASASGPDGGTTAALDTTGATLLVVKVSQLAGTGTPAVSDSYGNTWTPLTEYAAGSASVRWHYAANPTVGTGHTFTLAGTNTFSAFDALAFSGVAAASPFLTESGATGTGSSLQPGAVTPGVDGALVLAGLCLSAAVSSGPAVDSGFSLDHATAYAAGSNVGGAAAHLVQGTAASVNPTWSWSGSVGAAAAQAAFRPAASPPPPPEAYGVWYAGRGAFLGGGSL